jgi:hypothetical protein
MNKNTYAPIIIVFGILILVYFVGVPQTIYHNHIESSQVIAHWGFNSDATDSIGGYDGTVNGASTVNGKYGQAYSFDGIDDDITFADISLPQDEMTVTMWYKPRELNTEFTRFFWKGNSVLGVIQDDTNNVRVEKVGGGNVQIIRDLVEDQWVHIAIVFEESSVTGYKNAGSAVTQAFDCLGDTSENTLTIGSREDNYFNGSIDEVMVYDRALSQGEIQMIYDNYNYYPSTATCSDNEKNGDEVAQDCGGSCTLSCFEKWGSNGEYDQEGGEHWIDCRFDEQMGFPLCDSNDATEKASYLQDDLKAKSTNTLVEVINKIFSAIFGFIGDIFGVS